MTDPEPSGSTGREPASAAAPDVPAPTVGFVAVLALLAAVAPLATDMYLPSLPDVTADLQAPASGVQLTLTAFMLGLAAGQLAIGPLSDAVGRRRPLLIGTALCLLASLACALAPTITVLILARFAQGLTGAAGVVLSRAIITDSTRGSTTAQLMSLMMVFGWIMPVLAPMAGGLVLEFTDWRGIFWVITALVALMVLGVLVRVRETLPPGRRQSGGLAHLKTNAASVVRNRTYVAATAVFALGFGALFSYISASPFVLQNVLGLSPLQFSLAFGVNALGMVSAGALNIRLVAVFPVRRILGIGVLLLLTAAAGLCAAVLLGPAPVPVLASMFLLAVSLGFIMGNASAAAMQSVTTTAGTGSALMGACQFLVAATVAPLVGLGGDHDPVPMAAFVLGCAVLAGASYLVLLRQPDGGPDGHEGRAPGAGTERRA